MNKEELLSKLTACIIDTDEGDSAELAQQALDMGINPLVIVDALTAGINELGVQFENLECFLPELIMGGNAMEEAMKVLTPEIEKVTEKTEHAVKMVVGNLQGDIHDIGREIYCTLCRVAGFEVINMGNDVKPDAFIDKALEVNADIISMSTLLTTSLPFAKEVLSLLEARGLRDRFKVLLGGGAVTKEYVEMVGADMYGGTAVDTIANIKKMYGEEK